MTSCTLCEAAPAVEAIDPRCAFDEVAAAAPEDGVVATRAEELVVALAASDHVIATTADAVERLPGDEG